jgi:hypothetical protein
LRRDAIKAEAIKLANLLEEGLDDGDGIDFLLPPREHARIAKLVQERIKRMTKEEFIESLMQVGILSPDGQLTEHYRDTTAEDEEESTVSWREVMRPIKL